MFEKKIVSILLCMFIVVSNFTFTKVKVEATTYLKPPVINSISIDKNKANKGDNVNITFNVSGDILEGMIEVHYKAPAGNAEKAVLLNAESEGKFSSGTIIGPNDAIGVWKISSILLYDKALNPINIYNSNLTSNSGDGTLQDLSAGDFEVNGTIPDITPPQVKSISLQNRTVTLDTSDDISGVSYVSVFYKAPEGNASKSVYCVKNSEGKYSGVVTIGQNDAIGKWKVDHISLMDNASNSINVYNTEVNPSTSSERVQDLSAGDIVVSGTIPDITPPEIKSISVDKQTVSSGGKVTVTVDASDDISGIQNVFIHYKSLNGNGIKTMFLSKNTEGKYSGTFTIGPYDISGLWRVNYISLLDNASNSIDVFNNEVNSDSTGRLQNLSLGDFEVEEVNNNAEPLPQKYITQNEYWTGNVIDGDLYIGPQAVLTINGSVTVNGNIYVLGAIKNYGNLTVTGSVYAQSFNWGNSTLYNGTFLMLGGTNSIASMVASSDPIDIPLKVYDTNNDTLIAYDGKASVNGAILPIADLFVDNSKVDYDADGTFNLNLDTKSKEQVSFKTVDVFGNEKTKLYTILNKYYDTNLDSSIDIVDLATVANSFNARKADKTWQEKYDYNCDGIIDIYDLVRLSKKIG